MAKLRIFADSISDIPSDWMTKYNIGVVPLYIVFEGQSFRDRIEMDTHEMYRRVDKSGKLPKTAAPSPSDFIQTFGPVIANGEDVLFISMSSQLSSTYQNALIAAREFPAGRVTVVDSMNVSAGTAMSVLLAARAATQGKSALFISEWLHLLRDEIQLNVLVDGLDYLHKGGRVSNLQHMLGSVLRIRPILYVRHGRVLSGAKYRGNKERVLRKLMESILSQIHRIDHDQVIIAHSLEEQTAEWLRNLILEETNIRDVVIIEGGCAICSHSGPHSIAISFILKPERYV